MISRIQAARFTDSAYCRPHDLLPPIVWSFSTTEYVEMRFDGGVLHCPFRGTDEKSPWSRDWRRNLKVFASRGWRARLDKYADENGIHALSHTGLHPGFMQAAYDVFPALVSELHRNWPGVPIILYGHSHGGPMAVICADLLYSGDGHNVMAVRTFGCPNFCNDTFSDNQANIDTINYIAGTKVLHRDPVPHYPLRMRRTGTDVIVESRWGIIRNHVMDWYLEATT